MRTAFLLSVSMLCASHNWAAETAAPPRAARSVHLFYPTPDAALFYNEMTVLESTPGSYFMAAGWSTGYFGIQELSDGRKVILFSVWDPTKGDDPNAVKQEERVECCFTGQRPVAGSAVVRGSDGWYAVKIYFYPPQRDLTLMRRPLSASRLPE